MKKGKIIPHPVIFTLISLDLIALILEYAVFGGTSPESLFKAGGLYAPSIQNGQIYRLLTTMFLHSGYTHFIVNAFCLFSLGAWIEKGVGHKWTLFIYLFGGLFSDISSISLMILSIKKPSFISLGSLYIIVSSNATENSLL